jgi:siroheme synthase
LDVRHNSDELRPIVTNAAQRFDGDGIGRQQVSQIDTQRRRGLPAGSQQVWYVRVRETPRDANRSNVVRLRNLDPAVHGDHQGKTMASGPTGVPVAIDDIPSLDSTSACRASGDF